MHTYKACESHEFVFDRHGCDVCAAENEIARLRKALNKIGKKKPHLVNYQEAADMACEFVNVAQEALGK